MLFCIDEERFHSFIWDEMSLIGVNVVLALFVLLGVKVNVLTRFRDILIFICLSLSLSVIQIFFFQILGLRGCSLATGKVQFTGI